MDEVELEPAPEPFLPTEFVPNFTYPEWPTGWTWPTTQPPTTVTTQETTTEPTTEPITTQPPPK